MPLFFNNRFNNFQNRNNSFFFNNNNLMRNNIPNNRFMQNNSHMINNQYIQNNQQNNYQNNIPSDITLKPLTEEELEKINEEIKENIEKNKKNIVNIEQPQNKNIVSTYIEEFIQDESNANIFYEQLSNKCNNSLYRDRLRNISNECKLEYNNLKDYYEEINENKFEPKSISINVNMPLKVGILLAIEEEIKCYDKLCKIIDDLPPQDTRIFYKMALKKLSRINNLQYMSINEVY
ncbi:hypothetical protein [[Clostridium] colinum]|uniref:hypothetical protein n=1 Tax=[Clostridium] colinum TaxID=36835 RepID=UPI00202501D4|nr:hypothetical protein [[Clostridium] colinum]